MRTPQEPPDENFITIGANMFAARKCCSCQILYTVSLLHCHIREGDCWECLQERTALHRFGLLHRAQIDCQGEELRSCRREHHLCCCRPFPLRGSAVPAGFTLTSARMCTPMSCSLTEQNGGAVGVDYDTELQSTAELTRRRRVCSQT